MIEREVIEFVAAVDFTDDCRVTLTLRKRKATLTVTEAKQLQVELEAAIREAERGLTDLLRVTEPARFDQIEPLGPDCIAGKHPCDGGAWDDTADIEVQCVCPCHEAVAS